MAKFRPSRSPFTAMDDRQIAFWLMMFVTFGPCQHRMVVTPALLYWAYVFEKHTRLLSGFLCVAVLLQAVHIFKRFWYSVGM